MGSSIEMDGATSDFNYAFIPASENLKNIQSITVCCWVFGRDVPGVRSAIIFAQGQAKYRFLARDNGFYQYDAMDRGVVLANSGISVTQDEWTFIALTSTFGETSLHINDQVHRTKHAYTEVTTHIEKITVGARDNGVNIGAGFNGFVDELAIYNRVLDDAEIADLYNNGVGLYIDPSLTFPSTARRMRDNLVMLMHMDEGEGATVCDSSPEGNFGILKGNTKFTTGFPFPKQKIKETVKIGTNLPLSAKISDERLPDAFGIETPNTINPSEGNPNVGTPIYILDAMQRNNINVFDSNPSNEAPRFSAVIEGTTIPLKKEASTGRLYISLSKKEEIENPNYTNTLNFYSQETGSKIGGFVINGTPRDTTVIGGVPLAIDADKKIILNDSDLLSSEIEEYSSIMWGGSPVTIGRIGNDWYLIVTN